MPRYFSNRSTSTAVNHALLASIGTHAEMGGDNSADVEARREEGVHYCKLVVGLVLGIRVDDHSPTVT